MSDASETRLADSKGISIKRLLANLQLGPLIAFAVIFALFTVADNIWSTGKFSSAYNIRTTMNSAALIAVPALGMTMIIIAGGIDLSAGTALTLCGTVMALGMKDGPDASEPGFALYLLGLLFVVVLIGCVSGLVNGTLITGTGVVPFIVTLGTMTIFLGIGQILADESTVGVPPGKFPQWLSRLCYTARNGDNYLISGVKIPTSVLITLVLAFLVSVMMNLTVFGRNVFAVGSSESTARLCGINVSLTSILVYTIAGIFTAIGGMLYLANIKNANPSDGTGKELEIIAAVVLGGGSLSGGRGSVFGTILGALIITTIRSGCTQLSIPNTYTQIAIGAIIIIAVIVDQLRNGSPEWLFRLIRR